MRALAWSVVALGSVAGCGASTSPLVDPTSRAASSGQGAPRASAAATEAPVAGDTPVAPPVPLHRIAVIDPTEQVRLFALEGRTVAQVGQRLFSLTRGALHRELALEKAAGGPDGKLAFGAMGGRYPEPIVVDRDVAVGKDETTRQLISITGGRVVELGRAKRAPEDSHLLPATKMSWLPDGRWLVFIQQHGDDTRHGVRFVPTPKSAVEVELDGKLDGPRLTVSRANGGVSLAYRASAGDHRVVTWAKGHAEPKVTHVAIPASESLLAMAEAADGTLFLVTGDAEYKQRGDGWERAPKSADARIGWPMSNGSTLLPASPTPLLRSAAGAVTPATWPDLVIEGRHFEIEMVDAAFTPASGLFCVGDHGTGLFQEAPGVDVIDVRTLPPSAAATPGKKEKAK